MNTHINHRIDPILHDKPEQFPYIVIDNLYDKEELKGIWKELNFLEDKLPDHVEQHLGSSATQGNVKLKASKGISLDTFYTERKSSNILKCNRKIFDVLLKLKEDKLGLTFFFKNLHCNYDQSSVAYYENKDYYKSHWDIAKVTCLTWLHKEPKRYTGGDLIFTDYDIKIDCISNRCVIFPGSIEHEVTQISMDKKYIGKGNGRWTIVQFLYERYDNRDNLDG